MTHQIRVRDSPLVRHALSVECLKTRTVAQVEYPRPLSLASHSPSNVRSTRQRSGFPTSGQLVRRSVPFSQLSWYRYGSTVPLSLGSTLRPHAKGGIAHTGSVTLGTLVSTRGIAQQKSAVGGHGRVVRFQITRHLSLTYTLCMFTALGRGPSGSVQNVSADIRMVGPAP